MIKDVLLAIGLVATIFTKLRAPGTPIGPGEICLLLWLLLSLAGSASRIGAPLSGAVLRLLTFWALFAVALCLGLVAAYIVGERNDPTLLRHDAVAYMLVAAISLFAAFQYDAPARLRRTAWGVVVFGSVCLAAQLAQSAGLLPSFGLEVWYYDRLSGWTTNSNQLALLCFILVLLSGHLFQTAPINAARLAAIGLIPLPVVVGLLTKSDAFVLSLVASVLACFAIKVWQASGARRSREGGGPASLLAVVASVTMLIVSAPLGYGLMTAETAEVGSPGAVAANLERDAGFRSELLRRALHRSVESAFLGLGPGPHLRRPAELREPAYEAYPNFEAHNTFADVTLQGGLLALVALLWLGGTAATRPVKAGLTYLPALIACLALFGVTHFIFRHPIVWFVLTLGLVVERRGFRSKMPRLASRKV
ncbi:MAG: O-antigen ligase family protein [Dichotomicrobium sp.]